jgi:hypothetical protein
MARECRVHLKNREYGAGEFKRLVLTVVHTNRNTANRSVCSEVIMKCSLRVLLLTSLIYSGIAFSPSAREQTASASARCQVNVPSEWGDFVGGSNYGLAFRDNQGTIRFVTQMPCGLEGPVNVALQIKRK